MNEWVEISGIAGLLVISFLLVRVIVVLQDCCSELIAVRDAVREIHQWHRQAAATNSDVQVTNVELSGINYKLEDILKILVKS